MCNILWLFILNISCMQTIKPKCIYKFLKTYKIDHIKINDIISYGKWYYCAKIKLFPLGLMVERYSLESGCILDLFLCFRLNKANDYVYYKELHKYIQDSASLECKTSSLFCKQNSNAGFSYGSPDYSVKLSHSSEGKTSQLELWNSALNG